MGGSVCCQAVALLDITAQEELPVCAKATGVLGRPPILADVREQFEQELQATLRPLRHGTSLGVSTLLKTLHAQELRESERTTIEAACLSRTLYNSRLSTFVPESQTDKPDFRRTYCRDYWQKFASGPPDSKKQCLPLLPVEDPTARKHSNSHHCRELASPTSPGVHRSPCLDTKAREALAKDQRTYLADIGSWRAKLPRPRRALF